ncbi:MAG: hypothetical protein P4M01_08250 [Acidobacteriota bacterium]|nr:hypothetical protein [Acidobacteriota bacterium]
MKHIRGAVAAVLLLAALALPCLAGVKREMNVTREGSGWVQETAGPLAGRKALQVNHFIGSVQIVTGAKSAGYRLRLHSPETDEQAARRDFADYRFNIARTREADTLQPNNALDLKLRAELIVQIPASVEQVHVDTLGGKVTVHGHVRHLDLRAHGGDIELDEADLLHAIAVGGSVTVNRSLGDSYIRSEGGEIRVEASMGELQIASLGGNIHLNTIANGRVESGGGNIDITHCDGALLVRNRGGGNINLGEMDGDVQAETGGGSIRIGVAHGMVAVSTAMGDIEIWKLSQGAIAHTGMGSITAEFIAPRAAMRKSELVTSMGNIVVYFNANSGANVRAITGASPSKRIVNEFPELRLANGMAQYGPRSIFAEGTIHGGGADLFLRTMVGQIELRNAR